jgi:hypothetical protein
LRPRPGRPKLTGERSGVSNLFTLIIAAGVFSVSFAAVVHYAMDGHRLAQEKVSEGREADAARLAQILLGLPGVGWYSNVLCTNGRADPVHLQPDRVQRFGLGEEPCVRKTPGALNLNFDKVRNLADARLAADPLNGAVDYAEARASLGLDAVNLDFHLRTWPVLAEVQQALEEGFRDPNPRVAYLGAYDTILNEQQTTHRVQRACGSTVLSTRVDAWVDVTNNGTVATAFEVAFRIPLASGTVEVVQHTPLVLPGATTRATASLPKSSDWAWAGAATVEASVSDVRRFLGSCTVSLAGVSMTAATAQRIYTVQAEGLESLLTGGSVSPKIYYAAYDGRGRAVSIGSEQLHLKTLLGLSLAVDTSLHSRGWETFLITLPDVYRVELTTPLGSALAANLLHAPLLPLDAFTPVPATTTGYLPRPSVAPEVAYVGALVQNFEPGVYKTGYASAAVPFRSGGDVFPDLKDVLNNDLKGYLIDDRGTSSPNDDAATLQHYTILVVGSGVDHRAMTSAAAKQAIRDWVYAGGYLVVLGSAEQAVQWLQPIFHSAITSASQPLYTPDASHPLLHTPNRLEYDTYTTGDQAWRFTRNQDAAHFTHVLTSGSDDILAVSNTGAFGAGRVLLTAYQLWSLTGQGPVGACDPAALAPTCAALAFLHNLLTYAYRDLYLDYGPSIPLDREVGVVRRVANVHHPEFGAVELIVLLHVF